MKRKIIFALVFAALTALPSAAQTSRVVTVEELFDLVESGSKTLRERKTGVDAASHAVAEAKSRRLPDIDASLSVSYNGNVLMTDRDLGNARGLSSPHFGNSFALEARLALYTGGALSAGVEMAELRLRQAETDVELSRSQQRFIALGQYLDLFKTDNGIKVYRDNIALTERLIADITAKHGQGMALKNDITRYELQMEELKLGLRRLEDTRAVINHQLCNSLGLSSGTRIVPDSTVVSHAADAKTEQEWQQMAAVSSPVLRNSGLGVQLAEQQLRMAKSDMRPKVELFATENFSGPFTYDIPPIDKNFNIWAVGIGIRYSLSSLFKSNKAVRRARAEVQRSRDSHAVTAETLDNQMQEAYTLYRQSFVDLRTRQKSVELASQNYRVVNDRYLAQLAIVTDMLDASNVKLDAELQEVNARANTVFAYYKMKYIAGEI